MHDTVTVAISAACGAVMAVASFVYAADKIPFKQALHWITPATAVAAIVNLEYFPHFASLVWLAACATSVITTAIHEWVDRTCSDVGDDLTDEG